MKRGIESSIGCGSTALIRALCPAIFLFWNFRSTSYLNTQQNYKVSDVSEVESNTIDTIARLNDQFRKGLYFQSCYEANQPNAYIISKKLASYFDDIDQFRDLKIAIANYSDFSVDEVETDDRSSGILSIHGTTVFWGIDYYTIDVRVNEDGSRKLEAGMFESKKPEDPEQTARIMSIYLKDEVCH